MIVRVLKPQQRPELTNPFGPAHIEHRSADCGLDQLGTYVMTFEREGESDAWTLQYEETAYVADGEAVDRRHSIPTVRTRSEEKSERSSYSEGRNCSLRRRYRRHPFHPVHLARELARAGRLIERYAVEGVASG